MDALYRDYILDHYKNPRNFGELEPHDLEWHDHNPLCGDELGVHILVEDGKVSDLRFHGQGCAISQASASLMTLNLKGKTIAEAEAIFADLHKMVTTGKVDEGNMSDLAALAGMSLEEVERLDADWVIDQLGIAISPTRRKCALLGLKVMRGATTGDASWPQ